MYVGTDDATATASSTEAVGEFGADLVVLLDADRVPCGTAPREGVHSTATPLHLAYSCWIFGADGRFLLTRRAVGKRSWPGVWTNSYCGHPRPAEALEDAVARGARHELGIEAYEVAPLLPDFAYRAVDAAGIVENEVCPVFLARTWQTPAPHPDEVAELHWLTIDELRTALATAPWALSPWFREQAAQLDDAAWNRVHAFATTHPGAAA